ncbi:hypothetical protein [Salmonella sp. NW603]|uniref:hypothetical protein n=1 Tax=Salmonella sp. NW603 TaxID=2948131 RepID=UPI003F42965D|nr:hypothetical protein [Salmonella enterica]
MTKAKNIFCFQLLNFSLDPFLSVDLANTGNLWHSVPNGIFVKRQCWRGLEYRFAQIYFGKKFLSQKAQARGACAAAVVWPRYAVKTPCGVRVRFQALRTQFKTNAMFIYLKSAQNAMQCV